MIVCVCLCRKLSDGLFLECCRAVAEDYPSVKFESMIIDNTCMQARCSSPQFCAALLCWPLCLFISRRRCDVCTTVAVLLLLHPFNGLFSRTTWVSRHQKGEPFWILLEQETMGFLCHPIISCSSNGSQTLHLRTVEDRASPVAIFICRQGSRRDQTSPAVLPLCVSLCVCALLALPLPGRLWVNMTSSRKPEVHNLLHCCQTKTEPRPQITCTENFMKVWMCRFWATWVDRHAERHRDMLIAILPTPTGSE